MSVLQDEVAIQTRLPRLSRSERMKIWWNKLLTLHTWKKLIVRLILYFVIIELAFVFVYPFLYMLITSFKTIKDLNDVTVQWIPRQISTISYETAWGMIKYDQLLLRSVLYVIVCTLGHLISCSAAAYALARYKFKGAGVLFFLAMLSFIIPPQTIILPQFFIWMKLGMIDSNFTPLILPNFLGFGLRGGLFIFIFRQFFLTIPKEMEESARIDGCGPISTFLRIIFPMSRSSFLVVSVLSLVWHWNDAYEPSMYILKPDRQLLPQMLPSIQQTIDSLINSGTIGSSANNSIRDVAERYNEATTMAATLLVILPLVVMYFIVQRFFIQGVERSGLIE